MFEEKDAIQRLKHGQIGGLEFLVHCHQSKAVRVAYLITRDLGLAEDVVQDAFLQVYRSIRRFDESRLFPTLETVLTPAQYDPSFPNTPTPVSNGSGLYLEKVIELPNSYILVGNFTDTGDLPGYMLTTGSAYDYLPRIENAEGNPVPFKVRDDIKPAVNWGSTYYWAYEIQKPVKGPLKITLDEIDINTSDTIRFDFDAGLNPQPGQKWQLNLPVHLGRYDYVIDTAEMLENGYLFRFHSRTDVPEGTSFQLDIVGSSQERGSTDGSDDRRPKDIVKYSQNITYLVPPPTGKLTV